MVHEESQVVDGKVAEVEAFFTEDGGAGEVDNGAVAEGEPRERRGQPLVSNPTCNQST